MEDKNNAKSQKGGPMATGGEQRPDQPVNEKTSAGGSYNSGVTSDDPQEKEQIEKQGTLGKQQPSSSNDKKSSQGGGLTKEEVPDSTNESTGNVGSGQRQDSN